MPACIETALEDPKVPIYEYACRTCEHEFETLQKLSEPPLVDCPECGEAELRKKVSAVRFRLKGGGWYETDFKSGDKKNLAGDGSRDSGDSGDSGERAGESGGGSDKESSEAGGTKSSGTESKGASGATEGGGDTGKSAPTSNGKSTKANEAASKSAKSSARRSEKHSE